MTSKQRFSDDILGVPRQQRPAHPSRNRRHRFIGIWFVVVNNRVFLRSWRPLGWYRTFLKEPRGIVQIADRVRDAVDRAYLDKYNTPGLARR